MLSGEVIPIIPVPKRRKAKASVWKDIGVAETDHVLKLSTVDDTKAFLMETFGIEKDQNDKNIILLDMFYYALQFCKENNFNSEKTSSLLSILKQTHEMATETPFGNLQETLNFFKDLILCHSVHRPPFSLGIFSPQEASAISSYFIDSYFRHFKLYKYIFTPQVQLDLTINYPSFPKTPKNSSTESKSALNQLSSSNFAGTDTKPDNQTVAPAQEQQTKQEQQQQAEEGPSSPQVKQADIFDPSKESVRELKRLISDRLGAEMRELQGSISAQLHQSDEAIGKAVADAADAEKKLAAKKKK